MESFLDTFCGSIYDLKTHSIELIVAIKYNVPNQMKVVSRKQNLKFYVPKKWGCHNIRKSIQCVLISH